MAGSYKIQEFAKLSGVTIKALRHYERFGLLKPERSNSGYRIYSNRDLERLEQIAALKFLGLSLQQIRTLLQTTALDLRDALRAQRLALEKKRQVLERALRVIGAAEKSIQPGSPADPMVLRTIIEAIDMQEGMEWMKRYYNEAGWEQRRRYYEDGPSPEWQALYQDANRIPGSDPGSPEAQALADRWLDLSVRAYNGDPLVQTDSAGAWADRENWPEAMKQRISEFHLEEIWEFIQQAALSARKQYFTESSWGRFVELRRQVMADIEAVSRAWQAQVDLFHDALQARHQDPAGRKGRELARRWNEMLELESGGDPEILAALRRSWSDREHWSATLRWRMEGLSRMDSENFNQAADFLEKAASA